MLGKLIKYDLKAAARIFILLHAIYLFICLMGRFFYMDRLNFDSPEELLITSLILFASLYLILVSALGLCTSLQVALRFYRNLFSKEGYLSWTLPVSGVQHLWGKILSGYILTAIDVTVIAAGLLILVTGKNVTEAYSQISGTVAHELGLPIGMFGLIVFLFALASCFCTIVMIYFCIAVGQLFPGHRILCAIAVYFISGFVIQIASMILMILLGYFPGYAFYQAQGAAMTDYMLRIFLLSSVLMFIVMIIQYIVTHYIMKKKINLI